MTNKKILIIEDEKDLAEALREKLTAAQFEVVCAFDGKEGINYLEEYQFDLVLLDVIMPKMDGFEVLKKIKKMNSTIPVVILSNLSQPEDEKRALDMGAKAFFLKSNTPLSKVIEYIAPLLAS